ncbi:MAG: Rpn family recombination-promoting nuclease/putative transposase, partial [Holosporales bacterium]|nr:Rpn family recombination-promoting nuclease/putative transposase [Holosporales bacterium]
MTDLLSPQNDFVFKQIFGVEGKEPILISFLNALFKGSPHVTSVVLTNTELSKKRPNGKTNRLDVRATLDDKTQIDIEIQNKNTYEIPARAAHYLANIMPEVIDEGDAYDEPKAIGVWITSTNIIARRKSVITEMCLATLPQDPDPETFFIDSMRLFFIELPKFKSEQADAQDLMTVWLEFLINPSHLNEAYLEVKEVGEAMNRLKYISADKQMREAAMLRQREINDRHSEMTVARRMGLAEGKAEGKAEG